MPSKSAVTVENHEARIQRLEESVAELRVDAAEVSTNLNNLAKEVREGFERVREDFRSVQEKIEHLVEPLATALKSHEAEDKTAHDKLENVISRVTALENHAEGRKAFFKGLRTFFMAAITGATAIGLKELVVYLVHR